jgi:plasmid replication initiation protein
MESNYLVTKSNILINSSYDLSLEEQKIILTLASFVEPNDMEFKPYKFKIKNFLKLIGIKNQSQYSIIPKITKELMKKVFEIQEEDGTVIQLAWLSSAKYKPGTGYVELQFSNYLKPYMLLLKDFYTSYRLYNVLNLRSKYSIRMYEILKSNQFKKSFIIDLEELKKIFKLDKNNSYKIYSNFKNRIIYTTQKEINSKTDIYFDFEEIKVSRKIKSIKFIVRQNENTVNEDDTTENIETKTDEEVINSLKDRIDKLTGGTIEYSTLKELYLEKGYEKITKYLANYHLFKSNKHNPVGFIIEAIKNDYAIPKESFLDANKPIQSNNFDQRKYDDEFFESLYDNFKE